MELFLDTMERFLDTMELFLDTLEGPMTPCWEPQLGNIIYIHFNFVLLLHSFLSLFSG